MQLKMRFLFVANCWWFLRDVTFFSCSCENPDRREMGKKGNGRKGNAKRETEKWQTEMQ